MERSRAVVYLAGCAVRGEAPDQQAIAAIDVKETLAFAKRHQLEAAVSMALFSAGNRDGKVKTTLIQAAWRAHCLEQALREVTEKLEAAGIWYLPLKGCVIKEDYPDPLMREMSDIDLLIDPARREDARELMESLGYATVDFLKTKHDVYRKAPGLSFELHGELFPHFLNRTLYRCSMYYRDVKPRLVKDGGNAFGYHFRPEDFYLFLIAHTGKHFFQNGIGLRPLFDVYVYRNAHPLAMDYVRREAEKMGLNAFEEQLRSLSQHAVCGDALPEDEQSMLTAMAEAGAFGSARNMVKNLMARQGGDVGSRLSALFSQFSVPFRRDDPRYELFAEQYPFFYRHRLLLPLLPLYRAFRAARRSPGRIGAALRALFQRTPKRKQPSSKGPE